MHFFVCQFVYLFVCFFYLFVCSFTRLFDGPFISIFVRLFVSCLLICVLGFCRPVSSDLCLCGNTYKVIYVTRINKTCTKMSDECCLRASNQHPAANLFNFSTDCMTSRVLLIISTIIIVLLPRGRELQELLFL